MGKSFTFKNYFLYAVRYWLITAICLVVGLAAGITYGIVTSADDGNITYRGGIVIAGISSFFDLQGDEQAVVLGNVYETIKSNAFDAMSSDEVRDQLYNSDTEAVWRDLSENRKYGRAKAKEEFFASLRMWHSGNYFYVSFTQKGESNREFSQSVVNSCLTLSLENAKRQEEALKEEDKLRIVSVREDESKIESIGLLKGALVGLAGGLVTGLLIVLVLYFVDRRILSYGDIADVTGRRLYGVSKGTVTNKVCPLIDCDMTGHKVLLVCGDEGTSERLATLYAEYAASAGHKTLRIDFSRGKENEDTFGAFMDGASLNECVKESEGTAVLYGRQSWARSLRESDRMEKLKKEYERVVICAPYRDDGSLGVLGTASDKAVFAIDQSGSRMADIWHMVQELRADDKVAGAVLEKTGKSYVGGDTYIVRQEEE